MRAAIMRNKKLVVDEMPVPQLGPGEVLVKTLACGICGSDLHALKFADKMVDAVKRSGGGAFGMDLSRDIVMGHEFCAEVVEFGPGTQKTLKAGARVCSFPILLRGGGVEAVGYSNDNPGGYAEFMRLTEGLLLPVPNGLSTEHAALTEPMAVGYHAVQMARLDKRDVPLVIGCGPVGLAVIAALKLKGAGPIIAADFSPRRRELAVKMGADVVVDPKEKSPYETWTEMAKDPAAARRAPGFMAGLALKPAVIFECVGVPGVIEQIMMKAPRARAHRGRRRVHGVGPLRAVLRHQQGTQSAVRARIHAGRIRDHAAQHRRGQGSGRAAGDRQGRRRGRGAGVPGPRVTGESCENPRRAVA